MKKKLLNSKFFSYNYFDHTIIRPLDGFYLPNVGSLFQYCIFLSNISHGCRKKKVGSPLPRGTSYDPFQVDYWKQKISILYLAHTHARRGKKSKRTNKKVRQRVKNPGRRVFFLPPLRRSDFGSRRKMCRKCARAIPVPKKRERSVRMYVRRHPAP